MNKWLVKLKCWWKGHQYEPDNFGIAGLLQMRVCQRCGDTRCYPPELHGINRGSNTSWGNPYV